MPKYTFPQQPTPIDPKYDKMGALEKLNALAERVENRFKTQEPPKAETPQESLLDKMQTMDEASIHEMLAKMTPEEKAQHMDQLYKEAAARQAGIGSKVRFQE